MQIPSLSKHEGEVGRYLSAYCERQGLKVRRFTEKDSSYNFSASLYPLTSGKPNLIFLSHLDVVEAAEDSAWQQPPFGGVVTDSAIWGRGSIDAKGLTVMQLIGILRMRRAMKEQELPFNATLLCVSSEEQNGALGSKIIVNQFIKELNPIAVFGEGGSGLSGVVPGKPELPVYAVSVAEKSNLWLRLDLSFTGHGHGAAAPNQYANKTLMKALYKLTEVQSPITFTKTTRRMFHQLGKITGGIRGFVTGHSHWWIFRPVLKKLMRQQPALRSLLSNTATLTHLYNPPGPVNQIAQSATALLDCRLLPGASRRRFIREIKYGLFEPRFKVTILEENPEGVESSVESEAYYAMERAFAELHPGSVMVPSLFPASTDNNYFRAAGINVYGILPILARFDELETIHGPNERLRISELERGIKFYELLLRQYASRPPAANVKI